MSEGRTKKTMRNTVYSMIYQLLDVVLNFVLRTIFIRTLGKTYLGLSGLFSNILTVLSLMELGVGGAIVFALYKPLADHDDGKVAALMQLYKRVYTLIGTVVCIVGFALTPFLKYIINVPEAIDHIYLIYWLSIANTAISYFMAYRRSLLIADQRSDINIKNQLLFRTSRFIVLSASLVITRNYIVYLMLDVVNTFASNVHITCLVRRRYAYIEKAEPVPLSKSEKNQIVKYMSSGIFTKFGQTIVNCTDSIMISTFVNTILVGFYSNYSMITNSLDIAVYLVFSGITASIGNFAVEKRPDEAAKLFQKVTFVNYCISFYFVVCLASLLSPFVSMWAGTDYVLSDITVAVIVLNFYIASMQKSVECFVGAVGEMSYRNRYRSLIEGIVNLSVSLCLVKYTTLGITGVFLGTTVCFLAGRVWMDARVLLKHWFQKRFVSYIVPYILRMFLTAGVALLGRKMTAFVFQALGMSLMTWIMSGVLLSAISCLCLVAIYRKTDEYTYLLQVLKGSIRKLR